MLRHGILHRLLAMSVVLSHLQLPAVMQYELPQLMASFKMVGNEYK